MDNLPELRDIHLPSEGVSVFPLAYGWWAVLVGIVAFLLLIKIILIIRRQSKKLYAKYLLNKYAKEDNLNAAIAMSEILRRICLKKYPQAVAYTGKEWIDFLQSKTKHTLSEKLSIMIQTAPYRDKNDTTFEARDIADLRKFCFDWVGENL